MRVKTISWDEEAFVNFVVSAVLLLGGGACFVVMMGCLFALVLSGFDPFRGVALLVFMVLGLSGVVLDCTTRREAPSLREGEPSLSGLFDLIEKMLGEADSDYFPRTARRQILLEHINRLEERCHYSFCVRAQSGQMSRDQFAEKEKRLKHEIKDLKKRVVGR